MASNKSQYRNKLTSTTMTMLTQEVDDALEATVEDQANNADEAIICYSDFSYLEEYYPAQEDV